MTRFMLSVAVLVAMAQVTVGNAIVVNPGFETPAGLEYGAFTIPQGSLDPASIPGWMMGASGGGAPDGAYQGIWNVPSLPSAMGGTFTGYQGSQVGMIALKGSFYQDIAGFVADPHTTVSFLTAGRTSVTQPDAFKVTLDGVALTFNSADTITPASQTFTLYTSDEFLPTAGTHRLAFTGLTGADATSFIDSVSVNQVPEPTTLCLVIIGLLGLLCYAWRKQK